MNERKEAIYQKHGVNVKSQKLADKEDIGLRRLMRYVLYCILVLYPCTVS